MIEQGFLKVADRDELIELARYGLITHRLARRANALILLDGGMSCTAVGKVLLLDDDTIRGWRRRYMEDGFDGLVGFDHEGSTSRLNAAEQDRLAPWIAETLPHSTREVGSWIEQEFGIVYQSRSGLVALLHRLGMEHRRPQAVSRKLDVPRQKAFIEGYEALLNSLSSDEAVMFADAVHPTRAVRPVGCWAPKESKIAVDQTSGRQRLNIHGAITNHLAWAKSDLETGQTRMLDVLTVDAMSTISLLTAIENLYPTMRRVHVFLDNARYHHAIIVQEWLARPGRRIILHFVPPYCPHLNPIERLWGLMHKTLTHNRCYASYREFCEMMPNFFRESVAKNWDTLCDNVSDNFRIIPPKNFGFWSE